MAKKIALKISGMSCASCAINIERLIKKEKGIISAGINFASEKGYFEFNEKIIKKEKIKEIIEKAGYKIIEENHHHHHEEKAGIFKRNTIINLFLSLGAAYLAMGMILNLPMPENNILIQFSLASVSVIISMNIWKIGIKGIIKLMPNMDSLIFLGTAAAYFYSTAILLFYYLGYLHKIENIYFESTIFILFFITLGKYLESITKGKTNEAVKKLISLQPQNATVIKNGKEIKIPISELKIGDIVLVKPGGKIPADGIIIEGYSAIDEKAITGESVPIEKKAGDTVIGATINKTGAFKFKVVKTGKETMLAQIVKIVEKAIESKPPIQLLADKVSFYFIPSVFLVALLSFAIWIIMGQSIAFALTIFVTVLIIACPCALGLATPTAIMMGTGLAAENGILIKNTNALEIAKKIDTVVFDKTGTLTKGEPVVTDIVNVNNDTNNIIRIAASVEKKSEHSLSQAIIKKAKEEKIKLFNVPDFKTIPGKGVIAKTDNKVILLGTKKLISENKIISAEKINDKINELEKQGKTTMILAVNKEIIGIIAVADTLKEYSRETIELLHKMNKKVAIITGDNKKTGEAIANEVGADYVLSELLPQEKSQEIKKLQKEGKIVAMVGDGINDAPALAQSNLGIAMGTGTDIALETGEIILIKDDLRDVIKAIDLSKYTLKKIKQNLFWAFFYNTISIPIAAGVLYPKILINPAIAAGAMAFSSISVILNALLMKRYK